MAQAISFSDANVYVPMVNLEKNNARTTMESLCSIDKPEQIMVEVHRFKYIVFPKNSCMLHNAEEDSKNGLLRKVIDVNLVKKILYRASTEAERLWMGDNE